MKIMPHVSNHFLLNIWLAIILTLCLFFKTQILHAADDTNELEIKSITVEGKSLPLPLSESLSLGYFPKDISFRFGAANTNIQPPLRLRARLEGFENEWHLGQGFMSVGIRFLNNSGDQINQTNFEVFGSSAGWNGSLNNSALTH